MLYFIKNSRDLEDGENYLSMYNLYANGIKYYKNKNERHTSKALITKYFHYQRVKPSTVGLDRYDI